MNQLKKLVKEANESGIVLTLKEDYKPMVVSLKFPDKQFCKVVEAAMPYVFHFDYLDSLNKDLNEVFFNEAVNEMPAFDLENIRMAFSEKSDEVMNHPKVMRGLESLPFECVSVELQEGVFADMFANQGLDKLKEASFKANCNHACIILKEKSFGKYEVYSRVAIQNEDRGNAVVYSYVAHHLETSSEYHYLLALIGVLFCPDKHKTVGTMKLKEKMKVGKGLDRVNVYVNKVLFVCPYKKQSDGFHSYNREIEWSNKWLVSGHWRKLKPGQIGKDRYGDCRIDGHTWVKPFEKGNKEARLKKRVREVSGEDAYLATDNKALINSLEEARV